MGKVLSAVVNPIGAITGAAANIIKPGAGKLIDPIGGAMGRYTPEEEAAQAYQNGGRPAESKYLGITDEKGDLIDKYKSKATGEAYKQIASQKIGQDISQARDTAAQGVAGSQANARSALATRGGLQGGMAARLAMQGMQNQANQNQGITTDQINANLGMGQKAFDLDASAEATNQARMIADQQARNQFAQDKYKTQMSEWASTNLANSQLQNRPKQK